VKAVAKAKSMKIMADPFVEEAIFIELSGSRESRPTVPNFQKIVEHFPLVLGFDPVVAVLVG
jgi:hypothetical protein